MSADQGVEVGPRQAPDRDGIDRHCRCGVRRIRHEGRFAEGLAWTEEVQDSLLAYANSDMPPETTGLERAAFFYGLGQGFLEEDAFRFVHTEVDGEDLIDGPCRHRFGHQYRCRH